MSPIFDGFFRSWPFDPWIDLAILVAAIVYFRGWRALHRRDPGNWHGGRLACYLGGLAVLFLAMASPLEPFAGLLLQAHMVQHLLFMMVAPPLLWLGAPLFPILRGVPRPVRVYWLVPILHSRTLRRVFTCLTHPFAALPMFVAATWLWHAPSIYEYALRSSFWHSVQHACFLGSALLFWYSVVRPYPSRPRWSRWILFPYLILADVQNTVLSALLTFSDRVLYTHYTRIPRVGGLSALDDQSAAGVIMWVPGSIAYLLPLFVIGIRALFGERAQTRSHAHAIHSRSHAPRGNAVPAAPRLCDSGIPTQSVEDGIPTQSVGTRAAALAVSRTALPIVANDHQCYTMPASTRFDLLRIPVLGTFLKWRHARLALQLPMVIIAAIVIADGLTGPRTAAMNFAGVLPWIHWRGFVILGLLAAGNIFCKACPFMLPRNLARRLLPARLRWPRRLRSKWLAVVLLALFLWAYEAFSLWDSPLWTAWIAIGYFVVSFVVDGLFRGASFCKYVCPIGQFNFVQSQLSPLEVKVRENNVCHTCITHDCIRGNGTLPGCELGLYLPRKSGNLDCTFCLDCLHACPHDNVGIIAVQPAADLLNNARRSGIGRLIDRPDLATLSVLLVFGAFVNAAGMVAPVVEFQSRVSLMVGQASPFLATSLFSLAALVVLPCVTMGAAGLVSQRWGALPMSPRKVATRFAASLVPLGFAMWLAHYSFHLVTSYDAVMPVAQRFAADCGWPVLGAPLWGCLCGDGVLYWLPRLEIVALDGGLLLTLYTGFWISFGLVPRRTQALKAFIPWAILSILLFLVGVWLVLQPMQMRGTMPGMD